MDYSDKTKEELISELKEITELCKINKQKYEEEILLARQTEAGAKRSEEIFRKAFLVGPDSVNINKLSDGLYVSVNEGFTKIMGYAEEEVIGKTSVDLNIWVNPEDRINLVAAIGKRGKVENFEADFRRKDGSIINGSMSASIIDIDNVPHNLNITKDITERKRTELENQVFYEISQGYTSSDNLEDFLSLIHASLSNIVYAENCFVALYDQKAGSFSFPYFVDKYDTVPLPTAMLKSCTAYVFRKGKPFLFSQSDFDHLVELNEVELVGSASPSWIGIPLQTYSQTIGVLVLQHYEKENVYSEKDVKLLMSIGRQIAIAIERRKAEEEIKLKNELLEALNIEKDKFFSIIAHDLRGPLSAFVAATRILEEDIQNMTFEEIRDITISMKTDAANVYQLLENLLEWSRLQRGVMEFNPVKLKLFKEINASLESVSSLANKKGILIEVSVNDELEITADNHMLSTVVRNMVSNAVKFTPAGGKVTVSAKNMDNNIEISVTDTGIGMTQDMKNKLFHMNEKTGRKGTDGEPSSGLGLLLCKDFIGKHGGVIRVESEEGRGSTFSFTMPSA